MSLPAKLTKSPTGDYDYPLIFDELWLAYPRRVAKHGGYLAWRRCVLTDRQPIADLLHAAREYASDVRSEGTLPKHVLHAKTFFGLGHRYREYLPGATTPRPLGKPKSSCPRLELLP